MLALCHQPSPSFAVTRLMSHEPPAPEMLHRDGQEAEAGHCKPIEEVVEENHGACKLPQIDSEEAEEQDLQTEEHRSLDRYGGGIAH